MFFLGPLHLVDGRDRAEFQDCCVEFFDSPYVLKFNENSLSVSETGKIVIRITLTRVFIENKIDTSILGFRNSFFGFLKQKNPHQS